MIDDDDDLSDLESRMRAKLDAMTAKPTAEDAAEQKMVARLLGTKTQAEEFFRHEARAPGRPASGRIDIRRPKPFKSDKPILRFAYWEGSAGITWKWHIERYENGKRVTTHSGGDWTKRDELLIKLQAAGHTCTPITVAGNVPRPIEGRMRDRRKPPSGRFDIMAKISTITSDDVAYFDPEDLEY